MRIRGDLPRSEIDTFLERATIPLRLACRTPADRLWMLSLWFRYRDGALHCATSARADVVEFLEHDTRVAFEVSTNDPPYRGVRGRGSASIAADPDKARLRELLERYVGATDTPLGRRLLSSERDEVTITIEPEVLFAWDYTERMRETDE